MTFNPMMGWETSPTFSVPRLHSMPVAFTEQIRAAEALAFESEPSASVMERAGAAACEWIIQQPDYVGLHRWWVMCGPGNNGGDGWVVARRLMEMGRQVWAVVEDGALPARTEDAATMHQAYLNAGGRVMSASQWLTSRDPWEKVDGLVDALFGIGLTRPPQYPYSELIHLAGLRPSHIPLIALDLPSGLNADTGSAFSPCIQAQATVSFIALKPGLLTAEGPDHTGHVALATLDIQPKETGMSCLSDAELMDLMPKRRKNSHKGSHGDVWVMGGAKGMTGAALLAARMALHAGCGRTFLQLLDTPQGFVLDLEHPEIMVRGPQDGLPKNAVFVIGPGMGQEPHANALLERSLAHTLENRLSRVLDADALNLASAMGRQRFTPFFSEECPTVITPHPLEAARLLQCSAQEVQSDRIGAAQRLATLTRSVVVLKGQGTVVSRWTQDRCEHHIHVTGGPALASGGTGDVLAGLIGSLMAQGLSAWDAARLGVHLHGASCDAAPGEPVAPSRLVATEVIARVKHRLQFALLG